MKKTTRKIMVALGGNALGTTPAEQKILVRKTALAVAELVENGDEVVVAHGNGPQVGMINLGLQSAFEAGKIKAAMPFPECGAMSQGYIGYHLQNAIGYELKRRGLKNMAAAIITQVVVDKNDPAFICPAKPVGAFYTKEQSEALAAIDGAIYKEDAGRGYRKVVASPKPLDVIEKDVIRLLVENGAIVIAAGGGGIPVIETEDGFCGVDAVIDKDFASEKLAELLGCDVLLILTAVERVAIRFGKPDQLDLDAMTPGEARKYIAEGFFAAGSMLPKVEAALGFAESGKGRISVITSLEKATEALAGKTGTRIG